MNEEEIDPAEDILSEDISLPRETLKDLLGILAQKIFYRNAIAVVHHKPPPPVIIKEIILTPKQYERRFIRLCDYMATVINQTYMEEGENARLSDDQALVILRDMLLDFDETIMVRNGSIRKFTALQRRGFILEAP